MNRSSARAQIQGLVQAFQRNRQHYESPEYNEAHVRNEFIDPFFEALGWDVHNRAHKVGRERDVVVEDRAQVRSHRRRPDYGFRVGGELKFFVEAKRPSADIANADAAFQVKSCAWSAGAPLGVLMDFAHLRGFDGTLRPEKQAPEEGLLNLLNLSVDDYLERFDVMFDALSREAVGAGNLERLLENDRRSRRGRGRVRVARPMDADFLGHLETWRKELASELARRNTFGDDERLAEATQRILDRVLFLRVCEDREIEPRELLRTTLLEVKADRRRSLYPALVKLFRRLAPQYNGTLFAEHFSEQLRIEKDDVLVDLIEGLYDPAPYRFDVVPVELLGSVYERFLGSTIRVDRGGRAHVEEKPEVRHAGGVYYTPPFIVNTIVERVLGPLLDGKTPEQMDEIRVLDPACGSGSFLLAAFQLLVEKHEAFYRKVQSRPGKYKTHFVVRDGVPRLTLHRKQDILTHCIFGVDLDAQAVEVAQMSLYLKLLEGERDDTLSAQLDLRATYLPPLMQNVRRGNSLIQSQDLDPQADWTETDALAMRPFDWSSPSEGFGKAIDAGGFDAIVGNPPYVRIQELQKWAPNEVATYKRTFKSAAKGNFDVYVLFIEQAMRLVAPHGRVGLIVPYKFFQAKYGAGIRALLAVRKALAEVIDFGDAQVFAGATTYTCLFFLNGSPTEQFSTWKVGDETDLREALSKALRAPPGVVSTEVLNERTWDFLGSAGLTALRQRLGSLPTLGSISPAIFQGPITGADYVFLLHGKLGSERLVKLRSRELEGDVTLERDLLVPVLRGSTDVKRWATPLPQAWLIRPYVIEAARARLLTEVELRKTPETYAYLQKCRRRLEKRVSGPVKWYAFSRPQNLERFDAAKFLVPYMVNEPAVLFDEHAGYHFVNVATGGYGFTTPTIGASPRFVMAILQSSLAHALLRSMSSKFRGGYFPLNKQFVERLPIRVLDLANPLQKLQHDALVVLADRMIAMKSATPSPTLDAALEAADREIDERVYDLYGVTEQERRRIEAELGAAVANAAPLDPSDPLDRLRAGFGPWRGSVPTEEDLRDTRREAWEGYVDDEGTARGK